MIPNFNSLTIIPFNRPSVSNLPFDCPSLPNNQASGREEAGGKEGGTGKEQGSGDFHDDLGVLTETKSTLYA